jgi:hypothetical protein
MDVEADVDQLAGVLPLADIIPFPDLVFGGGILVAMMLLHGLFIGLITRHFYRRSAVIARQPHALLRLDGLLAVAIFLLLALHLAEIVLWTGALVWSRLVGDWRVAAFFAANTYTTLGYGTFVLPPQWNMMAPIIAISGLFTFGWTASVLVDFVRAANRARRSQLDSHDDATPH